MNSGLVRGVGVFVFVLVMILGESVFAESDSEKKDWQNSIALGFNLSQGNSDTLLLHLDAKSEKIEGVDQWRFKVEGDYGESNDEKTAQTGTVQAQYIREVTETIYGAVEINISHDDLAELDYRIVGNPAIGFFLIENDSTRFRFELGPAYVLERVSDEEDDFVAARAVERLTYKLSETARIFHSTAVLLSLADGEDVVVEAEIGIEAAINNFLSLVLTAQNSYDSKPAESAQRNDFSLVTALQYQY